MYLFPLQCQHILKLTSVMMLPENFATAEPVKLMTVILQPREDTGLVGLSIVTRYTQNDKDVSLLRAFPSREPDRVLYSLAS